MSGLEQLNLAVATLLTEIQQLRAEVRLGNDPTRPLSAEELCQRWNITGPTPAHRLRYLTRLCRAYGLTHLEGRDGWNALYRRADVLRAEEHGAGKIRSRKRKPKGRAIVA